ncbi:hypothetical protein Tco_0662823 [Tanacetum coccineum]
MLEFYTSDKVERETIICTATLKTGVETARSIREKAPASRKSNRKCVTPLQRRKPLDSDDSEFSEDLVILSDKARVARIKIAKLGAQLVGTSGGTKSHDVDYVNSVQGLVYKPVVEGPPKRV